MTGMDFAYGVPEDPAAFAGRLNQLVLCGLAKG
jgi:hypothetical protein